VKILAVSDHVADPVYRGHIEGRFDGVELAISCGDLPYSYLEYIVTMLNVPAFYVHGNHDHPEYRANGTTLTKPGGWINLDGRTAEAKGVLLAGLEGSIRYKPRARYQYTEPQMAWKAWSLAPALFLNRLRYGRYLDILVAHSPPRGIHDGDDLPHRGFETFLGFIELFKPRYLFHGHKHAYHAEAKRTRYAETDVINVDPFWVTEY
jgi:Icc-related predicted phosphoesterase